jgi:hypothetical protein
MDLALSARAALSSRAALSGMAGPVPAIHPRGRCADGRVKPGNDDISCGHAGGSS